MKCSTGADVLGETTVQCCNIVDKLLLVSDKLKLASILLAIP